MLLIREHDEYFTLFLSAQDQIVVGNSKNSFQQFKIPEPPVPENLTKGQLEVIKKENRTITCMTISKDNEYVAVTTENKQLVVFSREFKVLKNILLPRVSSKVCFSSTNDIIVADRTGDVYLYKLVNEINDPVLILGHLSVILDILVTYCGKYIITCDRDEKIRVSHYPNTYNIATFCLGHTEFVTCLRLLRSKDVLLSASGDGTVRFWKYLDGKQIKKIDTSKLVDTEILEKLTSQMDLEKVEVNAIPLTDIQIYEQDSNITLTVTLYNVSKLFLYDVNPNTFDYVHLETIDVDSTTFSYCLCSRLYILSKKLRVLSFINKKISVLEYKSLQDKLLECKDLFVGDNVDILLLYKRKFDNVQEYMERKKLRLETK